jgi:ribosome-associated protein
LLIVALFIMVFNLQETQEAQAILTVVETRVDRSPETLKSLIEQSLDADKAEQIETIDLRGQTDFADFMIVASGTSTRHVAALAEKIQERLKARGYGDARIEGSELCNWVVVDAGDVVVHIFRPEVREYYNIEKMWRNGPASEQKVH